MHNHSFRSNNRHENGGAPRFRKRSFGGRPQFQHGSKPRFNRNRGGSSIDVSKLVNKSVVEEKAVPFTPQHRFEDFQVDERIKRNVIAKGYTAPTPIQDKAIPHILKGCDVVGIANTGTGKTGAFLIPLLHKVISKAGERVLIMVPTRELAIQIEEEFRGFAKSLGSYSTCCVGGANINPQMASLRRRPAFVIGTPGRLKDLIERRALDLSGFRTVVLDEADRMLDMGFREDMKYILSKMPTDNRHTLFFSATLSSEIEALIGNFLKEPVRVSVKTGDTSKNVEQDVVHVEGGKQKIDVLHDLLIQPGFDKVLVFGRTKHGVEKLSKLLEKRGFKTESIHGNKTHQKRQKALGLFKESKVQILCATDVAARGLDIAGVSHVINYDLPTTYEDYVHRIGRTGRGEAKGKALTLVEPHERRR